MVGALGLTFAGNRFQKFLASRAISQIAETELLRKLSEPLHFQWKGSETEKSGTKVHGFDVTLLIDLCRVITQAEAQGLLSKRHQRVIEQAHIILNASAKAGIRGLVYALAGYRPETEEVINAFKLYIQEEAKKYEKEFPNEIYLQWHRLYDIPVPVRGKPWHFKHLTVKHIYYPLAQSNGKILQLVKALKSQDGDRQKKLFQFLNEVGARALRMQLGRVLEMAESSKTKHEYDAKIVERFGGQTELQLDLPSAHSET